MKTVRITLTALLLSVLQLHAAESPDPSPLYEVSLFNCGATAKGTGASFNKDWPPNGTLQRGLGHGGTLFGAPLTGGRVDVRLSQAVDIKAVEVVGLDYNGTRQPKAVDVLVDDKLIKHSDLEEKPGKPTRIPLDAHGRVVSFVVTDEYPIMDLPNGKKGVAWGGWARLRVFSPTNLQELVKPVDQYLAVESPANIAPTAGSSANAGAEVTGEPRVTKGHPCTLWDAEDIAHYKEMLKTSTELQSQFAGLLKAMDHRMTLPPGIPPPLKGPDGAWRHISDQEKLGEKSYGAIHNQLGLDIANLGEAYVLTGEAKYADFCKTLLLAYADAYPNYAIGARPGFAHSPSKAFDQILSDATWIIPVARGYDLIHDLPSITPDERKHIEEDLLKGCAKLTYGNHAMIEACTNWSAIGTCAVLTIGYACDDPDLVDIALYGIKGTKDKPTGGLYLKHFGDKSIDEDGLWAEGAMGYQFMALEALIMDSEVLWHHGIDMYRYRNSALKRLFDSPMRIAYPDLTTPATHDSGHASIVSDEAYLYEFAYRRYRDPNYLLILNQSGHHLDAHFQQFPVSVLYDRDATQPAPPVECNSVNFYGVGFGILRTTSAAAGTNSLLLEYGPNRSHGHPDKLTVDLYAFNGQLMIDPGSIWYEKPLYHQWYHTTLAHCTLTVDELEQKMSGAHQLIYGPGESFGIQRAWNGPTPGKDSEKADDIAYPGVTMDRAVFLTPEYMADIFGAFSRLPRKFDLAWHIRGEFASELAFEPMTFPEPVENGYVALSNVRHASTEKSWTATVMRKTNTARLVAAGGIPTEVIVGDGWYGAERPPAILERRTSGSTVYGNAVDFSNAAGGYVKNVVQEGGLDAGYGLLKVETAKGVDLCFAAYHPGTVKTADIETDAQQAYALMDGKNVRALYLAGGAMLKVAGASLQRSEPGLASIERSESGVYIVANPSPSDALITATFPALEGMDAFTLDTIGQHTGAATFQKREGASFSIQLKAGARVEFAAKGAESAYAFRQNMLKNLQTAQEAERAKAREECVARTRTREADAAAHPVPSDVLSVVQADKFSAEGGEKVKSSTSKAGAVGPAILGWDTAGHWLEWTFDAPTEGYYNLTLCYCSALDKIEREIQVNGEVQEPFAPMDFPSTGGWANGSDDWRLLTAMNPVSEKPLLLKLKQGKNTIRLTNTNDRGINVNYVAISSPGFKLTRELLAAKLPGATGAGSQ